MTIYIKALPILNGYDIKSSLRTLQSVYEAYSQKKKTRVPSCIILYTYEFYSKISGIVTSWE